MRRRDRQQAGQLSNQAALDELWTKRIKNAVLAQRLNGADDEAIEETLRRRYEGQLKRAYQARSEDAFQAYMNAFTGMWDPHTSYFSPRTSENFNINMSLSLEGIGAVLQSDNEYTKVVRLVPGGPASKQGQLQPADRIVSVAQGDEKPVNVIGWRLDEVVDLIRGPKGTKVRLEILPANSTGTNSKTIAIVRDEVKLEEQSAQKEVIEVKDGDETHRVGVIDIPTFYIDFQGRMENKPDYRSTTRDVSRLINELKDEDIEGLIIDLRNNGGGSLEEAINLTGLFIPQGPVVQVRSTHGRVEVLPDVDPSVLYDGPLTVLVNRLSASASEIFAGAIQDYGRGLIVGGQTFGKGTVQSLRPLRHGQLKITQAKFYRVSGDSTQHQGVIPDILYPSLFDKEKIGESALDEALPWDTIRPAEFVREDMVSPDLSLLREKHQKRIEHNPDFRFLREQKALIEELRDQTQVSLNEKTREEERQQNEDKRLKIENERRKAKGLELLTSLDEETEKEEEKETAEEAGISKDSDPQDDALLMETGHILMDYINIEAARMTAQRQKAS